uniref:PIAS protein inhibitor of activated STAT n=1 Tax=Phallusia mammillata TaxID=59560 RepID=A0A6F9DP90_9ASCI|nr:PIAS protein inhibitor of activated STAT [Phallusia mammillata]
MTSTQVDIDSEMKNMVMCFRVSELQVLLGHAGRNKSGRKHELMSRALQLIRSSGTNKSIRSKIVDLYGKRFPHSMNRSQDTNHDKNHLGDTAHNNNNSSQAKEEEKGVKVKFCPLPFYEFVSAVLNPSPLYGYSGRLIKEERFIFRFTSQQVHDLCGDRSSHDSKKYFTKHSSLQIQFRICLLDSTTEQSDLLPQNLHIKVNAIAAHLPPFVPPTKAGVDPKRPNLPINITTLCYASSFQTNVLDIRWSSDSGKHYVAAINIVRQVTAEDLYNKLKKRAIISANQSRSSIQRKLAVDGDSDISTTSLEVSLLCPLGKMRMSLPIRPQTCNHLQCFDARLFLKMNEKKPTWRCPVCDKPAAYKSLVVDELFQKILESCDAEEITFKEDGSWHTSRKKTETLVIGTPIKPIDLSQTGSKLAKIEERKKPEPEVIDLTCDSSDDEPLSPIKLPSPSPLQVSDDAAMSISSSPIDLGSPAAINTKLLDVPSHLIPVRKNLPSRGHPSVLRSTPPYARSPNPMHSHSPHFVRKSPITHSPSYPQYASSSPSLFAPKSPRRSFSPNQVFQPHSYNSSPSYPCNSPTLQPHSEPSSEPPPNPNAHRPPVISHSSPPYLLNGVIDTPPSAHNPSPLVSATPPGFSHAELGLPHNGYSTPPLHMLGNPTDYLSMGSYLDPRFSLLDYFRNTQQQFLLDPGLYARTLGQNPAASSGELRTRQMPAPYNEDNINYSSGGIL